MSKKQQGTNAAAIEKRFGVTLPERLRRFFDDKESAQHQGRSIHGLPNFSNDTKMPLDFASRRLGDIFEYASVGHFGETRSYLPLAAAGKENRMVAVDLSKPELPVLFFDYEDGFHPYAPGFDAFL